MVRYDMMSQEMQITEIEYESIKPIKSFAVDIWNTLLFSIIMNLVQRISFCIYILFSFTWPIQRVK